MNTQYRKNQQKSKSISSAEPNYFVHFAMRYPVQDGECELCERYIKLTRQLKWREYYTPMSDTVTSGNFSPCMKKGTKMYWPDRPTHPVMAISVEKSSILNSNFKRKYIKKFPHSQLYKISKRNAVMRRIKQYRSLYGLFFKAV